MDADLGFVDVAVDLALGAVCEDGAFDHAGLVRERRGGIELEVTARPIAPIRSIVVPARTPAAWMSWSRAVCTAMVKGQPISMAQQRRQ
ncbi:hypothetical protein AB0C34_28220 [Nocardia sp. NPDC049220]|uniref:hypothetical protein n=1 Tax=Nocardia sp. NPDC049220 TaxID=3155273 RepID=UPI0033F3FE0B